MSRLLATLARTAVPAVCLAASLVAAAPVSASPSLIGPNQYFAGNVNGSFTSSTIRVGCYGPTTPTSTGHPLPNQYVYASQTPAVPTVDIGFTGASATAIVVSLRLTNTPSPNTYTVGRLTAYDTRIAIPTQLVLPCSATGFAVFTPAPASSTSRADTVAITVAGQP